MTAPSDIDLAVVAVIALVTLISLMWVLRN
jgi:hypothetical protein